MHPSLATGNSNNIHRICQLLIVTDRYERLVAVGVVGKDNQRVNVAMVGERPTMILRARWSNAMPVRGDYIRSTYRPRCAYLIEEVRCTGRTADHAHLELLVVRIDAGMVPADAVVHPWRWDPRGKNAGRKTSLDSRVVPVLCDRHREVLAKLVAHGRWCRPRDLGGVGGSYHYATLCRLVAKGLVEQRVRVRAEKLPPDRYSYEYRATDLGRSCNV